MSPSTADSDSTSPFVRCPIHGIAYDEELEVCPACVGPPPPFGGALAFGGVILGQKIFGETRSVTAIDVEFYLPLALSLDDGSYEMHPGSTGLARVVADITWVPREGPPTPPGKPKITTSFHLHPDRRGTFSFSAIKLHFELAEPELPPPTHEQFMMAHQNLHTLAVLFTNRLIDVCRHVGGHYHLYHMNPDDLVVFQSTFTLEDGEQRTLNAFAVGGSGLVVSGREVVGEETARAALRNGSAFSFYDALLLNAQDSLAQGNHRLAVIETILALEGFLADFIRVHLTPPLGAQQVENWLVGGEKKGRKRPRNAQDMVGLIYTHLHLETPRARVNSWVRSITGPRTVLLHVRGRPPVELPDIAPRCVEALQALIRSLARETPASSRRRNSSTTT